jgi:ubiquinone/menaquinone biosynthesis C-methylase UbiE
MPTPDNARLIESQRQDWNRVASGWEKWDRLFEEQMAFVNHRLVADARLHAGLNVLDLGSGTGYPALLGAQVVGPTGSVVGMDLAEQMLAAAERKAKRLGLNNISFRTGDVTSLPFDANSFDAVTSRFCLMFLPEIPKAATEIARVLKPGSWSRRSGTHRKDPSIGLDDRHQQDRLPPPILRESSDWPTRRARRTVSASGIGRAIDQEFLADWTYGSADEYYTSLMEIAAPVQNLMAKLTDAQQADVKQRILHAASNFRRGSGISFPMAIRIVAARKPV